MSSPNTPHYPALKAAASRYPIIDGNAHNLLKEEHSTAFPLEGVATIATGATLENSKTSLPLYRAVNQLSKLYGCEPSLEAVKEARNSMPYDDICRKCLEPTGITSLLMDVFQKNVDEQCYDFTWHEKFAQQGTRRVVRVEAVAEEIIKGLEVAREVIINIPNFLAEFKKVMDICGKEKNVVGFKSIICSLTGLDITPRVGSIFVLENELQSIVDDLKETGKIKLNQENFNGFIILHTLRLAGIYKKPVQFHTGLGDNVTLAAANPSLMQPLIKTYPSANIVLLHSNNPSCREAGYLASVHNNLYLDFGEIFPTMSHEGQVSIVCEVLAVVPTNKLLWSSNGHWWPESYFLAVTQAREVLYEVLSKSVTQGHLTESQAVQVVEDVFYHNSNRLYGLDLPPNPSLGAEGQGSISANHVEAEPVESQVE